MQIPDDIKKGELVFLLDKDYNEVLDTDPKKLIGILGKFHQFATGREPNDYIFLETPLEVINLLLASLPMPVNPEAEVP